MSSKLDPILAAMIDDPEAQPGKEVVVMVGLNASASEATLAELRARGLVVRSTIGDVLTGAATLGTIGAIADHPAVVKIEASTPLSPERGPPPPG